MSEETFLHSAKRVCRFIRINDTYDGGLVTIQTIEAVQILERQIETEEKRLKKEAACSDQTPTK